MAGTPVESCRADGHIGTICNIVRTGSEPEISVQIPDHCRVEDETSVAYILGEIEKFGLEEAISHCKSQLDFIRRTPGCLKQKELERLYQALLEQLPTKQSA